MRDAEWRGGGGSEGPGHEAVPQEHDGVDALVVPVEGPEESAPLLGVMRRDIGGAGGGLTDVSPPQSIQTPVEMWCAQTGSESLVGLRTAFWRTTA